MATLKLTVAAMAFATLPMAGMAQEVDATMETQQEADNSMATQDGVAEAQVMPEQGAEAGPVTDAEVTSFASAAIGLSEINENMEMDAQQKQTAMAILLATNDLTADRFNYIGSQLESDPELSARFQAELAAQSQPQAS